MPNNADGFNFGGMKSRGFWAVGPAVGEILTAMIWIPADGILTFSFVTDLSYITKPEEFV